MLTPEQTRDIRPKMVVIQMIAAALIVGVIVFAAVIFAIVDWENLNEHLKMLSLIGTTTGILMFGFSIVAPKVVASSQNVSSPDQSDPIKPVLDSLMAEHIIRFALIELDVADVLHCKSAPVGVGRISVVERVGGVIVPGLIGHQIEQLKSTNGL